MHTLRVFVGHSYEDNTLCHELVAALRGVGADIWFDEYHRGSAQPLEIIERELHSRPVFILILSEAAVDSERVRDEAKMALARLREAPECILLPVLSGPLGDDAVFWLWLRDFKRIERPGAVPYPVEEAVRRTLWALALTLNGEAPAVRAPQLGEGLADLLTRGKALLAQGDQVAALPFFQVATQLAPTSWDAWHSLGYALGELQRPGEALPATEWALALDPTRAATWTNRGWQLCDLKRPTEALACQEQALALAPQYARAWAGKGQALYSLARHATAEVAYERATEALVAFEQALALAPQYARAWAGKGASLYPLKRYAESLDAFVRATELDPTRAFCWGGKGAALAALARHAEALDAFENAVALDPSYAYAWSGKASALRQLGRAGEAADAEAQVKA